MKDPQHWHHIQESFTLIQYFIFYHFNVYHIFNIAVLQSVVLKDRSLFYKLLKCRFRSAFSFLWTFSDKSTGWDRRRQTDRCIRVSKRSDLFWASSVFISLLYFGRALLCRKASSSLSLLPAFISNSTFETWDISGVRAELLLSRRLARCIRTRAPPKRATSAKVRRIRAGSRPWEASADMRTQVQEDE